MTIKDWWNRIQSKLNTLSKICTVITMIIVGIINSVFNWDHCTIRLYIIASLDRIWRKVFSSYCREDCSTLPLSRVTFSGMCNLILCSYFRIINTTYDLKQFPPQGWVSIIIFPCKIPPVVMKFLPVINRI